MSETTPRVLYDRDILKITPEGICFGDAASPEWILFDGCRADEKCSVGERDICANPPYILLHTVPSTKICFFYKGFFKRLCRRKAQQRFVEFHRLMEKYGAYTLDLS